MFLDTGKGGEKRCFEPGSEGAACDPLAPDCAEGRACIPNCPFPSSSHCAATRALGEPCVGDSSEQSDCYTPCVDGAECALASDDGLVCAAPSDVGDPCDPAVAFTDSPDDGCVDGAHCDEATSTCQPS